ncbi:hypothetical protein [Streptomyces minutiscleroticus]|uniref:hypothetical protein n=1 Tax=Streptomyces minutiscleroticus TaxID=68238 RepID=UPI00167D3C55|nr:hypothetical protein [Streptomyces minutiscleroticus]
MADPQSNAAPPAYPSPAPPLPADAPRAGVLHVRHRHTERYTVVGNHLAQHPRLSAVAIGLGVHIQSLPDGASVGVKALALRFTEGETTIARALNELVAAGYLVRRRVRLAGGRIATRTFFHEQPGAPVPVAAVPASVPAPVPVRVDASAASTAAVAPARSAAREAPRPAAPPPVSGTAAVALARACPPVPEQEPVPSGPAADLLARLRLADSRLLLPVRDVRRLVPAVDMWLARSATADQVTRTLTAGLPPDPVPIHHPARFLEHRLSTLLPPPLPATPSEEPPVERAASLVNCDGCDRAFRTRDPRVRCADCRAEQDCQGREEGSPSW